MKPRIAIIAALPRELRTLVAGWPAHRPSASDGCDIFESEHAIAVCAGMGASRARYAAQVAADAGPLSMMISAGYAGALDRLVARGTVHWAAYVLDGETGDRYDTADAGPGLLTVDRVLSADAKAAAGRTFGAGMVDMEAAAVAGAARGLNVPFRAVKAITDAVGDGLPDISAFVGPQGQFLERAYVAHLLTRPWLLPQAIQMGRRSAVCSRLLAQELEKAIRAAQP